jgi:hypothetical protein
VKVSQRIVGCALAAVAVTGFASCSAEAQDFKREAELLITGTLAKQIGLGDLKAACEKPEKKTPVVGDTFKCTGTTKDGQVIQFRGEVDKPKHLNLNTTNVLTAEDIPKVSDAAVASLEESLGITIGAENMDCGSKALVVEDDKIVCALTDVSDGSVYDATITFSDLEAGEFEVQVGEEPRG